MRNLVGGQACTNLVGGAREGGVVRGEERREEEETPPARIFRMMYLYSANLQPPPAGNLKTIFRGHTSRSFKTIFGKDDLTMRKEKLQEWVSPHLHPSLAKSSPAFTLGCLQVHTFHQLFSAYGI